MHLRRTGIAAAMILALAPATTAGAAAWNFQTVPLPPGATTAKLLAVLCWTGNDCMAVGYWVDSSAATHTLAEQWDGDSWTVRKTPGRAGGENGLTAIACVAAGVCTAVGTYVNAGRTRTLAEHWDGTTWSLQTTPNPGRSNISVLSGVACPTAAGCIAVGSYNDNAGRTMTLAETSTGSTWTIAKPRNHAGAAADVLSAVACPSSSMCLAVGFYTDDSGTSRSSGETWNGTGWALDNPRNGPGATALA